MGALLVFFLTLSARHDRSDAVRQWVVQHAKGRTIDARPVRVTAPVLERVLPGVEFYSLHFREYPVAMSGPEPMSSRNLFIADKNGVRLYASRDAFRNALIKRLPVFKLAKDYNEFGDAYALLSREYSQDGFFHFLAPKTSIHKGDYHTTQAVEQKGGDRGTLTIGFIFTAASGGGSKVLLIHEQDGIQAGVRPICQATKLLDPDPIVRRMAERDLLIMGRAARPYMQEQRAKASPGLQKEIDRVWQRILKGDR